MLKPLTLALTLAWLAAPAAHASTVSLEWRDGASDASALPALGQAAETNGDLWQRVRAGFKISDEPNPLIATHEAWYAARPDYLARVVDRARRYLYHIVQEVESRSMPTELALLPIVESAFNPTAYSPSDASGIWQFIPATGRLYGLKQDAWYDGRRDFTAATRAALDYLGKLYMDFGDWKLALAAYNCGEGCVARAIQKNAQQGLPTDYASLPLPAETRNYVPKLMAVKNIIADPARFNIALQSLPNAPYFGVVDLPPGLGLDIPAAARLANVSTDEFRALNAAHSQGLIRSDTPVKVLVPLDRTEQFQRKLASGDWDKWEPYPARRGESVTDIAERVRTDVERLERHNQLNLKRGRFVRDQTILVPVANGAPSPTTTVSQSDTPRPAGDERLHTVEKGDTLFSIARKYATPLDALLAANPGLDSRLALGQQIRLPAGDGAIERVAYRPDDTPRRTDAPRLTARRHSERHTVQRGDTLYKIATRYDVSVADLKAWNRDLGGARSLQPGVRLTIRRD